LPAFFLSFDKTQFLPKISNKGTGRKKGTKFTPKPTYKPVKKQKAIKKLLEKHQKNE
jgi:hypothetical protein